MDNEPNDSLWDSFWAEHAESQSLFHRALWRVRFLFSKAYANQLAQASGPLPYARMLEVGCGSARTLHYLSDVYKSRNCVALDLSPYAVRVAKQISPIFNVGVANAVELPLADDQFDISFSIGLIEHFDRDVAMRMVTEKIRVTRPGGLVGIMVPWQSSVYNLVVRKAFGKYWPFGHENPFRRREMEQFMQAAGLTKIRIHVIYGSVLLGIGSKKE